MKIVVPVKQIPSLIDDLELNDDGTALDEDSLTFVINEFDEQAIQQASLIKKSIEATVTVFGVDVTEELDGVLHSSLAKGADTVAKIEHDFDPGISSSTLAAMMANAIKGMDADIIMTGVQAADDRDGNLGPMIAAHLDIPYVGVVTDMSVADGKATVSKEYAGGVMAEFEVDLPVVIGIQAATEPPAYASISMIRKMAKEATIGELEGDAGGAEAGSSVSKMYPPESTGHAEMLEGSAGEVAQKIVDLLNEKGLL